MRDITVLFAKIKRKLGFESQINVEQGIIEVCNALQSGLSKDATDGRYRNAKTIVQ